MKSETVGKSSTFIVLCLLFTSILVSCSTPVNVSPTPISTGDPTATPTSTVAPTNSPTSTPELFKVSIQVFHDYNGNGQMDEGEPSLENIINITGEYECITDTEGVCTLGMLPAGRYSMKMDTSDSVIEGLDFVFYDNDVFESESGINIIVEGEQNIYIALGQGFLPQCPILEESFNGMSQPFAEYRYDGSSHYIYHTGIDCEITGDGPQPIYAPISGMLLPDPDGGWGECNNVNISFTKFGLDLVIGIGHLTEVIVSPNNWVNKGDIIGYINPDIYNPGSFACTSHPHIHFSVWGNHGGDVWNEIEGIWTLIPKGEWGWLDPNNFAPAKDLYLPLYYDSSTP